jgi:3-phenylpropionate/trans-cinnamate dioxygenase ferredoxin subunit
MAEKKYNWYKVANSLAEIDFSANNLVQLTVNGKQICLALNNSKLFACASKCPHAGGAMAAGYTDTAGNIVCPLHRYKFSLQTGRNTSGEGYYLKTYPMQQRDDGIYIGFEEINLFGWLK